jgi:copper chaperone CopZ
LEVKYILMGGINYRMKTKIQVKGMHCRSCEALLTESIGEIQVVKKVNVDYKNGTVEVDFEEKKINIGMIKTIIMKEGYDVE